MTPRDHQRRLLNWLLFLCACVIAAIAICGLFNGCVLRAVMP